MFSLFWFVLVYLMDRLIHVKNEVQLSTPRGFYTTIRNLSDTSYLISTPPAPDPPKSSSSSSSTSSSFSISSQPTLTITLADGNVLEAFKTMNFHRSKMNEYLCDDFITSAKITPIVGRILDSDTDSRNMPAKLIQDVGSSSYKTWLMGTISNGNKPEQRFASQRQDVLRSGYMEGHFKKPFYKVRGSSRGDDRGDDSNSYGNKNNYNNNVEDEDIYSGLSFPAYHVNRFKQTYYPIHQSTRNRSSIIPITLSTQQRRRYPTQLIPNENIIGVNLHGRYMNLTENYRKNFQTNVTPRDTFQRRDPSQMNNFGQSSNKETIAIYVTQSSPPSLGQMITDGNTAYWSSDGNVEISNYNSWPGYSDSGDDMQRNPQIPPPDTDNGGDSFGGYYYTTIPAPSMDNNNVAPYTQNYASMTESPREYTYPPYYPPSDVGSGFNVPVYGYASNNMDSTSTTAIPGLPQYTYQTPVTSNLYGYQPSITSWPYGWTLPVTTTTSMPMVAGWMPMTTPPSPIMVNTPPPTSTMPQMMAMVPMMPMMPTPPSVTAAPTAPAPQTPVPMIPVYGYLPSVPTSIPTPPNPYGYQPPGPPAGSWPSTPTPLPYGIEYTFNPPDNQNPHFAQEMNFDPNNLPAWNAQPHFANEFANSDAHDDVSSLQDSPDMANMQMQDMQDPRDNAISNILGPDAYELILTAIAFMAFGTYFMNMMLQLMQGNSPPTMMIIGNGGNNAAPPVSSEQFRKFSDDDDARVIDDILIFIDEFDNWLTKNSTSAE